MVTVAKFQGGGAFNVIPDSVTIGGTFRAFSKETFSQLKQRIQEVDALLTMAFSFYLKILISDALFSGHRGASHGSTM